MKNDKNTPVPDFKGFRRDINKALERTLPIRLARNSETFFKGNFRSQGWRDRGIKPWRKTATKQSTLGNSQGVLVGRGHLKNSIRGEAGRGQVKVIAGNQHVPYARIHNEGGIIEIQITEASRKFFWAMWYKSGKKNDMWKAMALTKKEQITIRVPKRKFIGESKQLNQENEKLMVKTLMDIYRKHWKS